MDLLPSDIIKLLVEEYLDIDDSLNLTSIFKKFAPYKRALIDSKKGWDKCVKEGKIDACDLIWHRNWELFDAFYDGELDFQTSCQNGNLELAQWLLKLSNRIGLLIDIHADDEMAFCLSCENGHFRIVKWLIQLSIEQKSPIDIHLNNEMAF